MRKVKIIFCAIILFGLFGFAESSLAAWAPPVGIPAPAWPANLDITRPTLPNPWTSEQAGWYFVSSSGCSDSRTFGNPTAARCTLPASPAAGSKIVLSGTLSGDRDFTFTGTSANPIWVMGYDPSNKPQITGVSGTQGSYIIFDNLYWNASNLPDINFINEGNHILMRDCLFRNTYGSGYGAGIGSGGSNLVYYRVTVYDQGNWQASTDVDRHGVKVYSGSDQWFVDSKFYHNQGDGIQVGDQNNASSAINRIYIGRNTGYENLQSCFWTKNATDVIFSSNTCYGINYSNGGDGQGIGGQYDPKYVWFLNNRIYDTKAGIKISGGSNNTGGPWYAIGNLIYSVASNSGGCNNYNVGGLAFRNNGSFTALFNTLYDVDMFVGIPTGSNITIRNNIFASQRGSSCTPLDMDVSSAHDYNLFSSASYDPGAETHRIVGDPKFVAPGSNFALEASSPAIGSANPAEETAFAVFQARYGVDIRKDFIAAVRPQNTTWDIGAYEYGGSAQPQEICGNSVCADTENCTTCPSDCQCAETYSITDFISLVADWLKNISGSPADVNLDGLVNSKDLGIMMSGWLP